MADYLVPVNPDIASLEAYFVDEADPYVNPLGAKGLGEIPYIGVAPAIANAVYHATGRPAGASAIYRSGSRICFRGYRRRARSTRR
jgi:CO/xanthine dehydrogenase Mo-binding subunit